MKAGPAIVSQSAEEALSLWERAWREDRPVGLDAGGNLVRLYGSAGDRFHSPASRRDLAKNAVVAKMRAELSQSGSGSGMMLRDVLEVRLPGLQRFLKEDEPGKLRDEWTTLRSETQAALGLAPDVLEQRTAVAQRAAPFLPPGLGMSLDDNGLSWLSHTFSPTQQDKLVVRLAQLGSEVTESVLGLDPQLLVDAGRQAYNILVTDTELRHAAASADGQQFLRQLDSHPTLTAKAKEVLRRLHAFCGGNRPVMGALSKLMNQHAISALMKADEDELRPASGDKAQFLAASKKANTLSAFRLRRAADGSIHLSLAHLKKGSCLTDSQFRPLCQLKPGPQAEIASERHFNFRIAAEIGLQASALEAQVIEPQMVRAAAADYVLDVAW